MHSNLSASPPSPAKIKAFDQCTYTMHSNLSASQTLHKQIKACAQMHYAFQPRHFSPLHQQTKDVFYPYTAKPKYVLNALYNAFSPWKLSLLYKQTKAFQTRQSIKCIPTTEPFTLARPNQSISSMHYAMHCNPGWSTKPKHVLEAQ